MFDPAKLHITRSEDSGGDVVAGRRYTLTHSDRTGDLFLSIGRDHDRRALRSFQVRLMRDEVLGEWMRAGGGLRLELHMMAQGGLPLFGGAKTRMRIFRGYRSLVLASLRHADRDLTAAHPQLRRAPVLAVFHFRRGPVLREDWGVWGDV